MAKKIFSNKNIARSVCFFIPAIPLAYFSIASQPEIALLSFLVLGALFLALRPFTVSTREATFILMLYLAVSGFLGFSQPLFNDSVAIYSSIVMLSIVLQPFIFLFTLDALVGLFDKTKRLYDMAVVVGLWLSTFAVVFGSVNLVQTSSSDSFSIFLVFLIPWSVNGFMFFVASFAVVIIRSIHKKKR